MNTCPALSKGNLSVSIHLPINLGIIQQKILFKEQTVDRRYIDSVPQTDTEDSGRLATWCPASTLCFLIPVLPSNGAHRSLEAQLQIRIKAKYQHPLALSGLVILWLFLTFLKI